MIPWNEKIVAMSIHPDMADRNDVARLATELLEANRKLLLYKKGLPYGSPELWEIIDPKFKWMAIDRHGCMRCYCHEISLIKNKWWMFGGIYVVLQGLNITDLPSDWRESKRQRPEQL
jgi:hypothetical protein